MLKTNEDITRQLRRWEMAAYPVIIAGQVFDQDTHFVNEIPTTELSVYAIRVQMTTEQPNTPDRVMPFGYAGQINISFRRQDQSIIVVVPMHVSSVFNFSETFNYYNFDNAIVKDLHHVTISWGVYSVQKLSMDTDMKIPIRVEVFYEPLRY